MLRIGRIHQCSRLPRCALASGNWSSAQESGWKAGCTIEKLRPVPKSLRHKPLDKLSIPGWRGHLCLPRRDSSRRLSTWGSTSARTSAGAAGTSARATGASPLRRFIMSIRGPEAHSRQPGKAAPQGLAGGSACPTFLLSDVLLFMKAAENYISYNPAYQS